MTISANVRKELFEMTSAEGKLIRIKPTEAKAGTTVYSSKQAQPLKMWTQEEHERFLEAMEKYPSGPWKVIASFIGSKTTRQTMTHAQKYRQKISRWRRGLRHKGRKQVADTSAASVAGSSDCDEHECAAKENLFKAIEYVSGDDMGSHYSYDGRSTDSSPVRSLSSIRYGAGVSERDMNGGECRSELFKLAELASFEVMKQEPPHSPDVDMNRHMKKQFDYEMSDPAACDENNESHHHKMQKMGSSDWRPSREWCTRKTEIKLSPLRGVDGKALSAITGLSYMSAQSRVDLRSLATCSSQMTDCSDDEDRIAGRMQQHQQFRLPPLNMPAGHNGHSSNSVFSIPPLRSKIDPSVFARAQVFATTS
ncbi:Myb-like dna-binding protein [Globisporangium polare]